MIGDACTDGTASRVAAVGDPRIRFENLPVREPYPRRPRAHWMVAGTGPMNRGLELASGAWIAALDDDEWELDHPEALLREARRTLGEVVYGRHRVPGAVPSRSRTPSATRDCAAFASMPAPSRWASPPTGTWLGDWSRRASGSPS